MLKMRLAGILLATVGMIQTAAAETVVERVDSQSASFRVVQLLSNLDHPWSMAWLPDGEALIGLRPGGLLRWRPGEARARSVAGLPTVADYGQGGLFDVKPTPDFAKTVQIVMSYAYAGNGGSATRIASATLAGGRITSVNVLFEAAPRSGSPVHFGGRLRFGPDGALYATFGDRGARERAQNKADPAGSVYRIPPGGKPELFSSGHRNPQGLDVHPVTGVLWAHEHGPKGGDEVNLLKSGRNYGWPRVTFGREYSGGEIAASGTGSGFESPLHVWVPSIAPSGMAFYKGAAFPGWKNNLFVGALRAQLLARLTLDGDKVVAEERLLKGAIGRIREVSVGPDGLVYLLTDAGDGALYRLEPLTR
jgi:aldose sugar dehydrogenase